MRVAIATFTERGFQLGERIAGHCFREGWEVSCRRLGGADVRLSQWVDEVFADSDALVFVGAAGIAVRAIAPYVKSKASDPAVVVVDEGGRFSIPLLSGHIGGANALANQIAAWIGAVPVITTATDGRGVFAVDSWAVGKGLAIRNPERIKAVSSALLAGETMAVSSEFPLSGLPPKGLKITGKGGLLFIGIHPAAPEQLQLVPRVVNVGLGCKRGTPAEAVAEAVDAALLRADILPEAVKELRSIRQKQDEPGILTFCGERGIPFRTFSAEELAAVEGEFEESLFVLETVGVGNVCERSAVLGGGRLLVGKWVQNGVTVALAVEPYTLNWGEVEQ